jgi:ParB family transcriptional regulator, chromosome partitioning protein
MSVKKPSLGRGLADLLSSGRSRNVEHTEPVPITPSSSATAGTPAGAATPSSGAMPGTAQAATPRSTGDELAHIALDQLQRGKYQPRIDMRQEALQELAISIRNQGVIQPIVVRPLSSASAMPGTAGLTPRYEIIAGERRWRAAQIAGLKTIPAVVRRVPDETAIALALIENIQREDLNPLEEARALERLIAEFGITHQQAADAVGRSRAAVTNLLRLLELAPEVAEMVERRQLEMGHARALLPVAPKRRQVELAQQIVREQLSVREVEVLVRKLQAPAPGKGPPPVSAAAQQIDPNVNALQQDLSERLGAKVLIQQGPNGSGRLVISYNSLDEFDGILTHIR